MTFEETCKIIASIMAIYPMHFKNYNKTLNDSIKKTWFNIFEDKPYQLIDSALNSFIATDTKGFPPTPGNINQMLLDMQEAANTNDQISESDAWAMVDKAIRDSTYHSKERFAALPPLVQQAVGSPENLKSMAMSDGFNQSVESSNFKRIYRTVVEREKNRVKIPNKVLNAIGTAEGYKPYVLEEKHDVKQIATEFVPEDAPEQFNALVERLAGKIGGNSIGKET